MLSNKKDAIETLEYNNITPEVLTNLLRSSNKSISYTDSNNIKWVYITRGYNRITLMAKTEFMEKYEEIYQIPKY
jgi:hypothetical protein